jgi:predicted Fe-Mo cluster-binding NifX family protein
MKNIYGVFFLLILSITVSSGVFAATGGKKVATMKEFNAVVCSYVARKMKEGLNERGIEKLINEHARTIDVLSSIYRNLGCANK